MGEIVYSFGTTPKRPIHPQEGHYSFGYIKRTLEKAVKESAPATPVEKLTEAYTQLKRKFYNLKKKCGAVRDVIETSGMFEQHSPRIEVHFSKRKGYLSVNPVTLHIYDECEPIPRSKRRVAADLEGKLKQ
jgi:hypothetical protein